MKEQPSPPDALAHLNVQFTDIETPCKAECCWMPICGAWRDFGQAKAGSYAYQNGGFEMVRKLSFVRVKYAVFHEVRLRVFVGIESDKGKDWLCERR